MKDQTPEARRNNPQKLSSKTRRKSSQKQPTPPSSTLFLHQRSVLSLRNSKTWSENLRDWNNLVFDVKHSKSNNKPWKSTLKRCTKPKFQMKKYRNLTLRRFKASSVLWARRPLPIRVANMAVVDYRREMHSQKLEDRVQLFWHKQARDRSLIIIQYCNTTKTAISVKPYQKQILKSPTLLMPFKATNSH